MNLVRFSLKTKGLSNFIRRLWTVFVRFGFSERTSRRALLLLLQMLRPYQTGPTLFIPAVILARHPRLLAEIAHGGAEIGIHGHVHNDYRTLQAGDQFSQTVQAIEVFQRTETRYSGFRNPYLGWTDETLDVFRRLGFAYESNEAVLHEVVHLNTFAPHLQRGFARSLELFQALPCTSYTLRPHFEGTLLRIPTSIPDDEMLCDRLRLTDPATVGRIWRCVLETIYAHEGIYTLNVHPERVRIYRTALENLLQHASQQSQAIWITRLNEVADWWRERLHFRLHLQALGPGRWQVHTTCTARATLLGRQLQIEEQSTQPWSKQEQLIESRDFIAHASRCPTLALSPRTPLAVTAFLREQGYALTHHVAEEKQADFACYLDLPEGMGRERAEQVARRSQLLARLEALEVPLLRFGYWPEGRRAALCISGDIDAVTIQDFFLRILEVR